MSILTLQELNGIGNASLRYVFRRDWLVDFKDEDKKCKKHKCTQCREKFYGSKKRKICKQCADKYSKK